MNPSELGFSENGQAHQCNPWEGQEIVRKKEEVVYDWIPPKFYDEEIYAMDTERLDAICNLAKMEDDGSPWTSVTSNRWDTLDAFEWLEQKRFLVAETAICKGGEEWHHGKWFVQEWTKGVGWCEPNTYMGGDTIGIAVARSVVKYYADNNKGEVK